MSHAIAVPASLADPARRRGRALRRVIMNGALSPAQVSGLTMLLATVDQIAPHRWLTHDRSGASARACRMLLLDYGWLLRAAPDPAASIPSGALVAVEGERAPGYGCERHQYGPDYMACPHCQREQREAERHEEAVLADQGRHEEALMAAERADEPAPGPAPAVREPLTVRGLPAALLGDVADVLARHGITPERTDPDRAVGWAARELAEFVEAYRAAPAPDARAGA